MAQTEQNFKNHARVDPMFHGFLFIGALILLGFTIYALVQQPNLLGAVRVFAVLWAIVLMFKVRLYAMKVQDRVIRLEERLRLQALAPQQWHAQIYRLNESQLIALRFAADDEVVELAKQALEHNLDRKQIKERIKSWRADDWRV